ncbi:hypothetical protein GCM10007071_33060 [Marinobacter zhanjiangensis]|uniref:Uncharacterized protein n=1 Tax=Marinobacter zhanjiangensis TaxID=578215 RepID=A0ABQ3B893_9GAMM|nr:hypothetical protein GCM10007071_33060 [Marinobacter zhanjiangensis]
MSADKWASVLSPEAIAGAADKLINPARARLASRSVAAVVGVWLRYRRRFNISTIGCFDTPGEDSPGGEWKSGKGLAPGPGSTVDGART